MSNNVWIKIKDNTHLLRAVVANIAYGFPSRKPVVIGVTGTKGKTTTATLLGRILEEAGFSTGWSTSYSFKIADREWTNTLHMTMPDVFLLQKLLRLAVKKGCKYFIMEVTSEGIKQWRHWGINFDVAVFTNLAPEHLEAHGSFENYKNAKSKLFGSLMRSKRKIIDGKKIPKIIIANTDDENSDYFLKFKADEKKTYSLAQNHNLNFKTNLFGEFNRYNTLCAATAAETLGVDQEVIQRALDKFEVMPGRMEFIDEGQDFKIIVDLAHTPDSYKALFSSLKESFFEARKICVIGAAGGIRDKWKRPVLGEIAAQNCNYLIITSEDPYNEDPMKIIDEIEGGIIKSQISISNFQYEKVLDRREAIRNAISLAKKGDLVLILGKGTEQSIKWGNKIIEWDDREVAREELKKSTDGL